jgi:hypothetical protein
MSELSIIEREINDALAETDDSLFMTSNQGLPNN